MNKFLFALVICCFPVSMSAQPMMDDPNLTISEVVSGLSFPTAMAFIGPDDILVLQKMDGKVMRVTNGTLQANPVLDVDVDPRSFGGLVGITLHPDFQNNNYVYLFYTGARPAMMRSALRSQTVSIAIPGIARPARSSTRR